MLDQLRETKLQRAKCVGDQKSPHLACGGYGFSPQHLREEEGGREGRRRKKKTKRNVRSEALRGGAHLKSQCSRDGGRQISEFQTILRYEF